MSVDSLMIPLLMLPSQGVRWNQPAMSRHNLTGLQLNSDWGALETVFQSGLNPFGEKPWLEGFPFARRAGGSGSKLGVGLFSKLSVWHCFWSLLIGQVGSDYFFGTLVSTPNCQIPLLSTSSCLPKPIILILDFLLGTLFFRQLLCQGS